ncbi:hypothetical protein [Sulfuritalea sp.]|uniref:hypothetical protein n=1 Tax=Sulfuritalea sp. TaxID=2480090 RepID=UPI001AC91F67|nr:hypothetical protein [Sulfuritalea sp.]MBN8476305.1 hypothetical protein [Sulfuritalea sp.]
MSNRQDDARRLAEPALLMALGEGDLPGWAEALTSLGSAFSDILAKQGEVGWEEVAKLLAARYEELTPNLTDSQSSYVSTLARFGCLDLLPEIADLIRARTGSTSADAARTASSSGGAFADFTFIDIDAKATSSPPQRVEAKAAIESIEHLTKKICGTWGSRELDAFLNTLIVDSRDGGRKGLPWEAASDVMFLIDLNRSVRALDMAKVCGIRFDEAFRRVQAADVGINVGGDAWSNPISSRDALGRQGPAPTADRQRDRAGPDWQGSLLKRVIDLLMMLATNKYLIAVIVLILLAKLYFK